MPQGACLSPTLFVLYVNDLLESLGSACNLTAYADDTSFVISGSNQLQLANRCNVVLDSLAGWFSTNLLCLNPSKTQCIRFHTYQRDCAPVNISINDIQIKMVKSTNFLGLIIDEHLSWEPHCGSMVCKLNSMCFLFRSLRRILTLRQLIMLYHAQAESRLRYGITLWGASSHAGEVFMGQKRLMRCLLGLHFTDSCRNVFKDLRIMTLTSLYIYEVCLYIFKNKCSFLRNSDLHTFDTRFKSDFYVPYARLDVTKKQPRLIGQLIFNKLPPGIKGHASFHIFKCSLKDLLLKHSFYTLEDFFAAMAGG